MNKIKLALQLLPVLTVLYDGGVLDICARSSGPYIQLTEKAFVEIFGEVEPDENGYLVTYLDGVEVLAVHSNV